jgi:hypothetical protein
MATRPIAYLTLCCLLIGLTHTSISAQPNQGTAFLGTWCAQGDPAKRTSIAANGPFLTLTNELGSTSTGTVTGMNGQEIVAPQWEFVRGTLSSDGKSISWSNGTFWSRCPSRRPIDLQGTWYMGGDQSKPCRIDQRGTTLSLKNESGQTASGAFTGKYSISTSWDGAVITGTISNNRNQILWSNGTYWTR